MMICPFSGSSGTPEGGRGRRNGGWHQAERRLQQTTLPLQLFLQHPGDNFINIFGGKFEQIIFADFDDRQNRTEHIRHQCRKTTVLSCHRHLINTTVEKMNYI